MDEDLHRDLSDVTEVLICYGLFFIMHLLYPMDVHFFHAHNPGTVAATHAHDFFQYIFWEQQRKASSLKDARSMKWHPLMI